MHSLAPIAITTGDHRGIGPEVISKGLHRLRTSVRVQTVAIFGVPELFRPFHKFLPKKWQIWTENELLSDSWKGLKPQHLNFVVPSINQIPSDERAAYCSGRYIELATQAALQKKFSSLVTGPIDKSELKKGGYHYPGHTEMLQALCKAPTVTMMMASPKMRISLVTMHLPLQEVASNLSMERISTCIENTHFSLIHDFGIKKPNIAVLGLNPHASDHGLFGNEEKTKITPAISMIRGRFPKIKVEGPFSPDGFFAQWLPRHSKSFDAIVCMYHDQGLIPIKLLDFKNTVNITLGLPIVRTSVDHGVGLDIAGKNRADPTSFCAALKLALKVARYRRKMA